MCGIVGILGRGPVAEQLVDSLKRLEYRGYDSAGVATLEGKHLERRRAEGKLKNLEARLQAEPLAGHTGIGHTRWATHGRPTENNAHPHATDRVAVVHNGIIENFRELREVLQNKGTVFKTETDTEIVLHLVDDFLKQGFTPAEAVKATLSQLRGAFALGFIFAGDDNLLIGARNGPPLAIGYGEGEMYLGSDAIALGPFTDTVAYLEDGDWVALTRTSAVIYDKNNAGTASYAGYVAKYWFERLSRVPVEVDVASEFRYREAPLRKGDLAIFISQSGETADTLAALRYAKGEGVHTLSVVNVASSTIARESETVLPTLAGPEIGVASTKAFTCQLMVLAAIAVAAGKARGELSDVDETRLVHGLVEIPRLMAAALATEPQIEKLARDIAKSKDVLYLGRGTSYPLALEGALKLKEISYIHAEGYAAGELKHGPIALIDENMPVVVIAPFDRVFEKTVTPRGPRKRPSSPWSRSCCPTWRRPSRRWFMRFPCSYWPIIPPSSWAPTSTSRAISRNR